MTSTQTLHGEWQDDVIDSCDHDDYDADILTGRAICNMCGYAWWRTTEEIEAECRRIAEYDEWAETGHSP